MEKEFNRILFWTFLGVVYGFIVGSISFAQTAILTPQGNYMCGSVGTATFCGNGQLGNDFSILPLGPNTYTVNPMGPTMPYSYPSLDEPKQPRESSTPLFFGASQAKPEGRFEAEQPKVPCYSLFREC